MLSGIWEARGLPIDSSRRGKTTDEDVRIPAPERAVRGSSTKAHLRGAGGRDASVLG